MTDKNNINKENTEKVSFMGKVKNFVKDHKIPTVITALVLVLAIGTGVVFGITKSSSNVGEFPTFSSDETGSDIDVPPIEPDDETSSETDSTESDGTVSTVVTQTPTPDYSTSSTVSTKEPSTSTPQYPTSSGAATSTPTTTTPTTSTPSATTPSTPSTPTTSTWTCPDPSAHPQYNPDGQYCTIIGTQENHDELVAEYQSILEKKQNPTDNRTEEERLNNCWICNKPFGNGYNGTCLNHFCDGSYRCHHYDIDDDTAKCPHEMWSVN